MKKIFYILVSAIVALGAVACNNEIDENIEANNGGGVSFTVALDDEASRVIIGERDADKKHTITFEEGDVIYAENGSLKPFAFVCDKDQTTFYCNEPNADGKLPTAMVGQALNFYTNKVAEAWKGADGINLKANGVDFTNNGDVITLSLGSPVLAFTSPYDVTLKMSRPAFLLESGSYAEEISFAAAEGTTYVPFLDAGAVTFSYSINGETIKTIDTDFDLKVYNIGVLTFAVAQVNGVNYTEISKAIEKVEDGGVVMVANDFTVTEPIVVAQGKNFTLDLNGNTLSGEVAKSVGHVIRNEGNLTIKGGVISSVAENGGSAIYNAEGATLTIENTTLNGAPRVGTDWPSYAVNNYGEMVLTEVTVVSNHGAIASYGKTTLNDCSVTLNGFGGSSHVFYFGNGADVEVNGGTYTHNGNVDGSLAYVMTGAKMTINDGTFTASNGGYGLAAYKGDIIINGGLFNNALMDWGGTFAISGGTFKTKPADKYIVANHKVVEKDGLYEVVAKAPVASIEGDETIYETLEDAFAAAQDGAKITLVSDATIAQNTTITVKGKAVTLDLNGNTVTSTNTNKATHNFLFIAEGNGTLTVENGNVVYTHVGENLGWNGAATAFYVTGGGVLNMKDVTVTVSGTDMNFGVHLNNWGEVTLNAENCVFDSTYCGVRVFNSGYDNNNVTIKNSTLKGNSRAFWVHNWFGDFTDSRHTEEAVKARMNLDIFDNGNTYELLTTGILSPIRYGFNETIYIDPVTGYQMIADGLLLNPEGEYEVYNANGLKYVATAVNEAAAQAPNMFDGKVVKLTTDINLEGAEWTPIGDYAFSRTVFRGTFDGQNHTVSNFKITQTNSRPDKVAEAAYGLFGNVSGVIKNLKVDNAVVDLSGSEKFAGVVAGRLKEGALIDNCHVTNSSVAINHWQVGGIAGQVSDADIKNSSISNSTVSGYAAVGGIAGLLMVAGDYAIENCSVLNCEIVQNGHFSGDDYDTMFGTIAGTIYHADAIVTIDGARVAGTTIKGVEDSTPGAYVGYIEQGAQLYINGMQYITNGLLLNPNGEYEVYNANGLAHVAKMTNEMKDSINGFKGKTIKLTDDIDLSSIANWTPIGCGASHFMGTFLGNNKTISNMTISERYGSNDQAALFGTLSGTVVIKDLTIEGAKVTYPQDGADFYGAGLIGTYYGYLTVENVTVTDSYISGNNKVAGLIAHDGVGSSLNVNNCHVLNSTIESTDADDGGNVAGILGLFQGATKKATSVAPYGEHIIQNSSVKGCTINAINSKDNGKRANALIVGSIISTDPDKTLVINNCTVEGNNFTDTVKDYVSPYGDGTLVGGWRNDNSNHCMGTVIIDGLTCVANGVMMNDAGEYVLISANGWNWMEAQTDAFFARKTITLGNDIDFKGAEIKSTRIWEPETPATFDGKNFTVKNFVINGGDQAALFNGTLSVKNLKIDNATVSGRGYVAILGGNIYGNIDNVHITNSAVTGTYWQVGGFAGQFNSGNITNSSIKNTTITGPSAVGALAGITNETARERKFENCVIEGCTIKQNGSFGGDYDNYYGVATGFINLNPCNVYFNNITMTNNTVKGAASTTLYGVANDGVVVYIDGVKQSAQGGFGVGDADGKDVTWN